MKGLGKRQRKNRSRARVARARVGAKRIGIPKLDNFRTLGVSLSLCRRKCGGIIGLKLRWVNLA